MQLILIVSLLLILATAAYLFISGQLKKIKGMGLLYNFESNIPIKKCRDMVYKRRGSKNFLIDIYLPYESDNNYKYPAVFFLHGEGPEVMVKDAKDWQIYEDYSKLLISKGYAVVKFNRAKAETDFSNIENSAKDISDAVKYIKERSAEYKIDTSRLGIWTFSMGGLYVSQFMNGKIPGIKCVISYYSALDISAFVNNPAPHLLTYVPDNYMPTNNYAQKIKMLIVKAENDSEAINESIFSFIKAAKNKGFFFELLTHMSGGHNFDSNDNSDETNNIINKSLSFLDGNL